MNVEPQIADRLAKLLRLACCSTAPDGERLAAINRLSATAAAREVDWDLALNGNSFSRDQLHVVFDEGYRRGVADTRQSCAQSMIGHPLDVRAQTRSTTISVN